MRKLLFLFVALLTTTTLFGREYFSLISVTDGTDADWDALPAEYVASATHTEGCSWDGLKSVKVYCDDNYLNILVEVNLDVVTDHEWTPFHIFLNADGSADTGGFGDYFADADAEWMLETAIYQSGAVAYNPAVFKWWGEVGGCGWQWTDPENPSTPENGWGAVVPEGSLPIGNAQAVGGIGKVEIQLLKELIPAQWANEFTIGFEIEQSWTNLGHLPNAANDEFGNSVRAEKLRVKVWQGLPQDGLYYEVTRHVEPYTVAVVGADADITTAIIPETIELYGKTCAVTSIGAEAFADCTSLTSIAIPNSITSIGNYAFSGCSSLTSITIPNSVTSIGNYAFRGCSSLTSITIPNSITEINSGIFSSCSSLTSITIPNSITSIGSDAFYHCTSLTSITISNSVTSIGNSAFNGCSFLTSIAIPNSITSIGNSAFAGCSSLTSISIPNSITKINIGIFAGCSSLTSITIPNNITSIGNYAFYNCSSLTSITIPNSVMSIGDEAFNNCPALTSVTWNAENYSNITSSDSAPFYDIRSQITEFIFGDKVLRIPSYLCYDMNHLTSITIGNSVTSIGDDAFSSCSSLTSVTIGDNVKSIGNNAFANCSALRGITLPASIQSIGTSAFEGTPRLYEVTCLAPEPPIAEESSFTNYDAYFHAYCDAQRYYSVDPVWKKFHNVECIVNENTVTNNVTITPSDCEATVVWLSNDAAVAYSLVITKNGVTFCTLRFNKYGQLTNIAFAPSRTHNNKQQAAEATSTGYSFTITGLDAGTRYDYQFSVLNDSNESIDEYFGEFTTHSTTAVEQISSAEANCQKLLRDGQLIILRDGKTYNVMGQEL